MLRFRAGRVYAAVSVEHDKLEQEQQAAATAAAEYVADGMAVGLGTGSTAAYLLPACARRSRRT